MIIEDKRYKLSKKGVEYVLNPKRGMATDINADICQPLTAVGQSNWTGSFVSPDIKDVKKSSTIGNDESVKITLTNGEVYEHKGGTLNKDLRIRKLTPKECWRLMGFSDEDFAKAESVCSNTQLYKQAGNSIVTNVLMAIFWELLL